MQWQSDNFKPSLLSMILNTYLALSIRFSRSNKVEREPEVPECYVAVYVLQNGSSPWKAAQSLKNMELQR